MRVLPPGASARFTGMWIDKRNVTNPRALVRWRDDLGMAWRTMAVNSAGSPTQRLPPGSRVNSRTAGFMPEERFAQ
jgi:hypothetical protein